MGQSQCDANISNFIVSYLIAGLLKVNKTTRRGEAIQTRSLIGHLSAAVNAKRLYFHGLGCKRLISFTNSHAISSAV